MEGFFSAGFLYNPKTRSVLLQKRDMKTQANPGLWGFFGGSSEEEETPEQSIIRELKEELGISVVQESLQSLRTYFNEKFKRQSYIFVIESELKKSEMVLAEGEDYDWIPLENVLSYDLTENTRKSLEVLIEKYAK